MFHFIGVCDQPNLQEKVNKTVNSCLQVCQGATCYEAIVGVEKYLVIMNVNAKAIKGKLI